MKFTAYSVSISGELTYMGTWLADSYDAAYVIIVKETGYDISSLRIYGRS